ncbi:MAG: hypothetical protein ACUZ8E_14655 [Candidatus Anammoxibacter sp.]
MNNSVRFKSTIKMSFRNLNVILIVFVISAFFFSDLTIADEKNEDEIRITLFKTYDDFAQRDTFKAKQHIIFYVLWNVPENVVFNGKVILSVEGEQVDGGKWEITEKKALRDELPSHHWGWDCFAKIPKAAKPGSVGTATVELSIEGYKTAKEVLTFHIEK